MQSLSLSPEESETLREVLRHLINDMDVEVFRTDTHDYKEMLKHRRDLLEHVLEKLNTLPAAA
jgi:hypothetical protein